MVNNSSALDATFAALADPTRRAILARLAEGSWTVSELAEPFDMSLPAVSKHLRVLENAGLLQRQKDGRVHHCSIEPQPIERAAEWIEEISAFWDSRLQALARYIEQTKPRRRRRMKK